MQRSNFRGRHFVDIHEASRVEGRSTDRIRARIRENTYPGAYLGRNPVEPLKSDRWWIPRDELQPRANPPEIGAPEDLKPLGSASAPSMMPSLHCGECELARKRAEFAERSLERADRHIERLERELDRRGDDRVNRRSA